MSKLQLLREAVQAAAPGIEADQLFTMLRDGRVTDTGTGIRYEATAEVTVIDLKTDPHPVTRALTLWLRTHEPSARDALQFEVDPIDNSTIDIRYTLPFSEVVVFDGDQHQACAAPLPDPDTLPLR
jgi:P2 phage tail completion protein R (GpR)